MADGAATKDHGDAESQDGQRSKPEDQGGPRRRWVEEHSTGIGAEQLIHYLLVGHTGGDAL